MPAFWDSEVWDFSASKPAKAAQGESSMKSKTIEAASGECVRLDRRRFLKVTSAGTALGVFGESGFGSLVYADTLGKERRDKMTPDES
jgi:hypothetical protein